MKALSVGFVMTDAFTLAPFALFIDHLRLAADEGDRSRQIRCQWSIMGTRPGDVRASCGVLVGPATGFIDPKLLDYVVVCGGLLHAGQPVDCETVAYLQSAARAGTPLIGICTGSFVLCRAGLMAGRTTCVSWYHHQDFLSEFPDHAVVADRLFLDEGNRITCAGGGGAADLATYLVERHLGHIAAAKSRQILLLDETRGAGGVQPHPPQRQAVADPRVRRALLLMEQNLASPLPISHIATLLDLSVRQLERLFSGRLGQRPGEAYRDLRLRYARHLLDTTSRTVTDIAFEAGFADCAHFTRLFRAAHGMAPSQFRDSRRQGSQSAGPRVWQESVGTGGAGR